jgi:endoglucanase
VKLKLFTRQRRLVAGAAALVAAVATVGVAAGSRDSAPQAFVRVNQIGYPERASKRAYLMSSVPESAATVSVRDARGQDVLGARIGPDRGPWNARYAHVYPLDFDELSTPGTYTIAVTGSAPATSPPFDIAPAAGLYATALANSLSFYRAERDGPDFIRSALRTAPAHLNDEHAMTYLTPKANADDGFDGDLTPLGVRIDASGGWWDAGDYPKFVETTSYTTALMLVGVRDFPARLGARSLRSNFSGEAKFGTDFLLRLWDDRTRTLYYQVGIGEGNAKITGDHDIWRLPQADDTYGGRSPKDRYIRERPVFRAAPPGSPVSPNLAGRDAASFALCYQVFRRTRPAYARRCLLAAEDIFELADTSPKGPLLTVFTHDFYPEESWQDDLELGAVELFDALSVHPRPSGLPHEDPDHYLRLATHWARAYMHSRFDASDTLNLYDVSGLAHFELYRALRRTPGVHGLETTRRALLADLERAFGRAVRQAAGDPFQFGFPWASWDTTSHGAGLSVMASELRRLTRSRAYAAWSDRWLANILGANAWGVSLVVGDGTTFPHCMQHQVANLVGSLDGSAPLLRGAVVEGPNGETASGVVHGMRLCPPGGGDPFKQFDAKALFRDDVQSYPTVEPAIDLGASLPLAFAWQERARGWIR